MSFEVKILGSSSALPAFGRNHSAQVVTFNDKTFLIDCGEGTQHQLQRYRVKINKINCIFISHLHGDHFLGLFGLISSMSLLGRNKKLEIYGPPGLKEILSVQLKHSGSVINYPLDLQEFIATDLMTVAEFPSFVVESFPLQHRITCNGYIFRETKRAYKLIRSKIEKAEIPKNKIKLLKQGQNIRLDDGTILNHEDYAYPPPACRKYAYCSDTIFDLSIAPYISESTLLYHESSFLNDKVDRAQSTFHSTAAQAGIIAKTSQAEKLIIGHFSSRYKDLDLFEVEAKIEFENTELALEGKTFELL